MFLECTIEQAKLGYKNPHMKPHWWLSTFTDDAKNFTIKWDNQDVQEYLNRHQIAVQRSVLCQPATCFTEIFIE